jgi:hypothetical protein
MEDADCMEVVVLTLLLLTASPCRTDELLGLIEKAQEFKATYSNPATKATAPKVHMDVVHSIHPLALTFVSIVLVAAADGRDLLHDLPEALHAHAVRRMASRCGC